jgi:hypothetical protein
LKTFCLSTTGISSLGTAVEKSQSRLAPINSTALSWREEDLMACSVAWQLL